MTDAILATWIVKMSAFQDPPLPELFAVICRDDNDGVVKFVT
jgi:hypothetical protein